MMFKYSFAVVLMLTSLLTWGAEFVEGRDYQVIQSDSNRAHTGNAIQVTEFFSYGCPWCYRLDSPLTQWVEARGASIHFSRVPVVFNSDWNYYAKAYYIIQALSLGKDVHDALFKAIVLDKQPLNSNQAMVEFFEKHGVESGLAQSAMTGSPSIEIQLSTDAALMTKYQINAVPTLLVDNQYKTNLQMAKTEKRLFEILDFLITKSS